MGAHGVELDVRLTVDGELVLSHDPVTESGQVIAETRRADLPDWMPSLADALDACAGMVVNVEVKNIPIEPGYDPEAVVATRAAEVIVERGRAADVVVSSFDLATIDAVRAVQPEMATGWLTLAGYDQSRALASAHARGHRALHPHVDGITAGLVAAAHDEGMRIAAWTVNDADRMRELAAWGVDLLITDDIPLALTTLAVL